MRKIILAIALLILLLYVDANAQINTLQNTRVGEWALYSTSNGSMQERQSVIARRRDVVVVKFESIINGKVISSRVENFNVAQPSFLRGAAGTEVVNVRGRSFSCTVIKRGNRTLFYSDAVPVTGLVLTRRNDEVIMEIIDFGK